MRSKSIIGWVVSFTKVRRKNKMYILFLKILAGAKAIAFAPASYVVDLGDN